MEYLGKATQKVVEHHLRNMQATFVRVDYIDEGDGKLIEQVYKVNGQEVSDTEITEAIDKAITEYEN
mgnify:CR=1 FL=1